MYNKDEKIYIYMADISKGRFLEATSCDVEILYNDDGRQRSSMVAYLDKGTQKTRRCKKRLYIQRLPGIAYRGILNSSIYRIWFREPQKELAKKRLLKAIKEEQKEAEKILNEINTTIEAIECG
jgi:hypothetical protein